jgi:hypothetical protein
VYTLCCEAEARQDNDEWADANERLQQALDMTRLRAAGAPLVADIHRRRAWVAMQQWRIADASKEFKQVGELLAKNNGIDAVIARLHARHGLAMARRFQGDSEGAVREYAAIIEDIVKENKARRASALVTRVNLAEALEKLKVRWINSLERLGDCHLFGTHATRDPREGAEDYRRALRLLKTQMPSQGREEARAGLLYRLAASLALPGDGQDTDLAAGYCA